MPDGRIVSELWTIRQLIWCDPVNIFELLGWFLYLSFRGQDQQQPWQVMATIDHADIRGSEPHNHDPSGAASDYKRESGWPVANFRRGFSFVLAPAAADPVLELDSVVHRLVCFCFFLLWLVFAFVFSVLVMPPVVACRPLRP